MLRAFQGESDTVIAKVKYGNVETYAEKIRRAKDAINKLGDTWGLSITDSFVELILEELYLVYEYQEKVAEEREEQRRIREEMKEEERVRREAERAQQEAEKEERRAQEALDKARKEMEGKQGSELEAMQQQLAELQRLVDEAGARKERALSQAQQTRRGHVYVISNIGSFGDDVFKIGMTRRLEPMDRIKELGDASVPFMFDVHAIIYSDDAPNMEMTLHRKFHQRRVNRVNEKREFFRVTLDEIVDEVKRIDGMADVEFTLVAEAREYRETLALSQS
jgi:multidrug efflux pump subunit AcrA (membrane-fusion protein)